MQADSLIKLREQIDRIDGEIVRLLGERAAHALSIGRLKQSEGIPCLDTGRERDLIESLTVKNEGPIPDEALRHIFTEIVSACRALQSPIRVAYLGPEATFSHQAALGNFGKSSVFRPQESIAHVFRDVEKGRADFGVVPVENSTEGAVGLTLDELAVTDLTISGEILLPISHALMSREATLEGIENVFSHPQALSQCLGWLSVNLPGRPMEQTSSTAAAAQKAAECQSAAAVGSEMLADVHGLKILARNIQDKSVNQTRFFIVGRQATRPTGRDKTSVVFATAHRPGALLGALEPFDEQRINITRIESRPCKETPWEYIFFLDCEGHLSEDNVRSALDRVGESAMRFKVLGSYPAAQPAKSVSSPKGRGDTFGLVPKSAESEPLVLQNHAK
jgi:chorismate mutase / prephenate dehydratase